MQITFYFTEKNPRTFRQANWDEIITVMKFFKHYSEYPNKVEIVDNDGASYVFEVASPIHYNTVIMMVEEVFSHAM